MTALAGERVVIFGCGYVGTAVAMAALANGARVTALTRNAANAAALRAQGVEAVIADLASDAWHEEIGGGARFVLSCVSSGGGGLAGYRSSYVEGMASVLAWARRHGKVETLVYTSSTSVYPQGEGVVVDESASTDAEGLSERAKLLLAAEGQLRAGGADGCARSFILRLAGIYGPGRHHFIDQVRAGEASGHGETHLNLIHRDDIVSAVLACWDAGGPVGSEIFNIADDSPARKSEITAWLAARMGVALPRFTGEPASGRRQVTPDRIISNAKAKATLGWAPHYSTFRAGCDKILSH